MISLHCVRSGYRIGHASGGYDPIIWLLILAFHFPSSCRVVVNDSDGSEATIAHVPGNVLCGAENCWWHADAFVNATLIQLPVGKNARSSMIDVCISLHGVVLTHTEYNCSTEAFTSMPTVLEPHDAVSTLSAAQTMVCFEIPKRTEKLGPIL